MADATSPEECARELARLLDEQTAVCRRILEKTRMQQILVEETREDELLSLLGDKQKLIDEHQKLSGRAAPFRAQWESRSRDAAGPDAHALVEKAWNGLREVLDEVIRLEDESRAFLEKQKNRVSMDIGKLQRGKIVNKAYGGGAYKAPSAPRYSDKQG